MYIGWKGRSVAWHQQTLNPRRQKKFPYWPTRVRRSLSSKCRVTQKRELLKNPTKIEEIQKKIIDRHWTITTCLLRDSNPYYQCLKITSCRWRPPPRMHSFTATTHFKSSRSFVSPCVCCMLCRRQVVMVQFLSIIFFSWISSIFVGFFKSSRFFVSPCTLTVKGCSDIGRKGPSS